jgi:hypothetical protein
MGPRAGLDAVEIKIMALPGIGPRPSNLQPVAIQIEISRFLYGRI